MLQENKTEKYILNDIVNDGVIFKNCMQIKNSTTYTKTHVFKKKTYFLNNNVFFNK